MSKRKLWATKPPIPGAEMRRHESQAAAYRYVNNEVANWLAGALRSKQITVYVDERDGRGWRTFDQVDLAELAEAGA